MNPSFGIVVLLALAVLRAAAAPHHWAFIPPVRAALPAAGIRPGTKSDANPVDRFIHDALRSQGIQPSPVGDRITQLRRLSLDLTGLPPSPEFITAFLRDRSDDAHGLAVEQLLASPHFGERWGRMWLDLARYADSNGYSVDAPRSIWKYRDWVIDALNRDMPYDQFVTWQIAGDLLSDATLDQRIATGFNRNTQINQEGGIDPEQFRVESVMDRVNTTATSILGITLACAQCHDHKFDPLTQRDYYRFYAFFNSTLEDGHGKNAPEGMLEIAGPVTLQPSNAKQTESKAAKSVTTLVMQELPKPRDTFLFTQGDFTRPSVRVSPGVPEALRLDGSASAGSIERQTRGTRLDLASWIVDPHNPLTARVMVNRIWQHYFGRGLVETENDFGTQGSPPSHPAMLDWLACELMQPSLPDPGSAQLATPWSLKHIHRLIVHSATYRRSSHARPDLATLDPNNRQLAHMQRLRLDAEVVRDVFLAASGRLDPRIGGPSVYPPQPAGVMSLGQSAREWVTSEGTDRYRRGLYTFFWRATPHPALMVFDAADAFSSCTRRPRSNTPLQALTLLNDPAFHELAQSLGERMIREGGPNDTRRIAHGFQLCTARRPSGSEMKILRALLDRERRVMGRAKGTTDEAHAWTTVARVMLNADETITRE